MKVKFHKSNQNPVCNLCGKELDLFDRQQQFTIHKRVQYGSRHDGENVRLNLCCDCFDLLVSNCRVSPVQQGGKRE